jgi:hypothetical protein
MKTELINNDTRSYIHNRATMDNRLTRWKSGPDVLDEVETRPIGKTKDMQICLNCCTCILFFANKSKVPMGCMRNEFFRRMSVCAYWRVLLPPFQ